MTARTDCKVTASDYRLLPEGGPRYQLVDGDLVMSPSPRLRHGLVVATLTMHLRLHAISRNLGEVLTAPVDVFFGENDVFQPDVLFVAAAHADRLREDGVHGAPDLVVEVLSPSTRGLDLTKKRVRYAAAGVEEAWYVDIEAEQVLVYRLQENAAAPLRTLVRGDALVTRLLPGFEIAVATVLDAR